MTLYLDASAAVKLIHPEEESAALTAWLEDRDSFAAAEVLSVEAACAIHRRGVGPELLHLPHTVLGRIELVPFSERIRDLAMLRHDPPQRALDAIHLGTALSIRERLEALVTYNRSLAEAAAAHGLPVGSPA